MRNLIPALIGLFVIAALLRIDTYFSLVYLLAATYVLGRVWSRQSMKQLQTQRRLVSRAFPGETISVELRVLNDGWLPVPWVEMYDSLPVDMASPPYYRRVLTMMPHQERRFDYRLSASKRGYYLIGPMTWRTGDLLGFAPQQTGRHQPETIIVYPRVVSLDSLGLPTRSPLASIAAPTPLFEDPTRVVGVRDYQIGDSPRRIHWTASAGADRLLVKRYQPAIARETLICLDLNQDAYSFQRLYAASELAIITAASLANHIIVHEGLAAGLTTQGVDPLEDRIAAMSVPARRGRAHLMSILEILARAQTYRVEAGGDLPSGNAPLPLADFLRRAALRLSWGATIVLITGKETDAILGALLHLRQQGFAVALILVMPAPPDDASKSGAAALRLPIHHVWREEELERI